MSSRALPYFNLSLNSRKSEFKILKLIYENPGVKLTELIRKAKVSVATAKKRLEHLTNLNIKEEKIMGGKKILLKNLYPNFSSEEEKMFFL